MARVPMMALVKKLPYCSLAPPAPPLVATDHEVLLLDRPWRFQNWSMTEQAQRGEKWGRARGRADYAVMTTAHLANLPLEKIAAPNAVLLDWATFPKMEEAIEAATYRRNARGTPFWTFKTVAYVWLKTTKQAYANMGKFLRWLEAGRLEPDDLWRWLTGMPVAGMPALWHFGSGFWTHGNVECCLIYTRGQGTSFRIDKAVSQLIIAPVGAHSAKPQAQYEKIARLLGDRKRIELFARSSNPPPPGWTATGLDYDGRDVWDVLGASEWRETLNTSNTSETSLSEPMAA